jgi:hypothetical protein
MYVNGAPELGETLFTQEIWKSTLKHIAVLTIITLMVHKNILLSLCWLLVTAGTLCHLCSILLLHCLLILTFLCHTVLTVYECACRQFNSQ